MPIRNFGWIGPHVVAKVLHNELYLARKVFST